LEFCRGKSAAFEEQSMAEDAATSMVGHTVNDWRFR
jgi:hypothetical protein